MARGGGGYNRGGLSFGAHLSFGFGRGGGGIPLFPFVVADPVYVAVSPYQNLPSALPSQPPPDFPAGLRNQMADNVAASLQLNGPWDGKIHNSGIPVPGSPGEAFLFFREGENNFTVALEGPGGFKSIHGDRRVIDFALGVFRAQGPSGGAMGLEQMLRTPQNAANTQAMLEGRLPNSAPAASTASAAPAAPNAVSAPVSLLPPVPNDTSPTAPNPPHVEATPLALPPAGKPVSLTPANLPPAGHRRTFNKAQLTTPASLSDAETKMLTQLSSDLSHGRAGKEEIEAGQKILRDHHYNLGAYGPHKDGVDGIAGKMTHEALNAALGVHAKDNKPIPHSPSGKPNADQPGANNSATKSGANKSGARRGVDMMPGGPSAMV